jgi:hypothetical protein
MALLDVETPGYGDKIKLDRQKQASPLPRRPSAPQPAPPVQGTPPSEPVGFAGSPPHTQRALWASNFWLKKANEPRPKVGQLDESQSSVLFAANMAIALAEATGDPEMAQIADEIMNTQDNQYDFYGALAAAKMQDIEIAEGVYRGIPEQRLGEGQGAVQGNAGERVSQPNTQEPKPEPTA